MLSDPGRWTWTKSFCPTLQTWNCPITHYTVLNGSRSGNQEIEVEFPRRSSETVQWTSKSMTFWRWIGLLESFKKTSSKHIHQPRAHRMRGGAAIRPPSPQKLFHILVIAGYRFAFPPEPYIHFSPAFFEVEHLLALQTYRSAQIVA